MLEHCILLVEDSADDVALIRRALKKAGVTAPVHGVNDGEAALAYIEGTGPYADRTAFPRPTLVLLDLKLPRRSGFEVLAALRAHPKLSRTIVVVLTSSREHPDIGKAYGAGANSYLLKPIRPADMQELMVRVREYWLGANLPPPQLDLGRT